MKKYIEISEELLQLLATGKAIEGTMKLDMKTRRLTFNAFKRKSREPGYVRPADTLIHQLENGWVKESVKKYKLYLGVYKNLGLPRILHIIDRETKVAKGALFDKELIESM